MPDEELIRVARSETLRDPTVLRNQVQRMIEDPRSWQFVAQFTEQWLDLDAINRVAINPEFYPDFDNALKPSMRQESLHFFSEVFHNKLAASGRR